MSLEVLPTKMSVGSCDPQGTEGHPGAGSALGGAQGQSDHLSPAVAAVPLPNPPGKGSAQHRSPEQGAGTCARKIACGVGGEAERCLGDSKRSEN